MMLANSTRTKRIAWAALSLIILSLAVVRNEANKLDQDAKSLLHDSLKLTVGKSSAEDVLAITRGQGRVTDPFKECTPQHTDDCYVHVAVENQLLRSLHLAPSAGLGSLFTVKDNNLVNRYIQMVAIVKGDDLHVFVNEENAGSNKPPFRVERSNNHTMAGIFITSSASDELRRRLTDFNLSCLSKIGGCKTFEEMLPALGREDWPWLGQVPGALP
jgi:hypothetical protein